MLWLHVPLQKTTKEEFFKSFDELHIYLQENNIHESFPQYIVGLSYLAPFASRGGFTVCDLPEEIQNTTKAAYLLKKYSSNTKDPIK